MKTIIAAVVFFSVAVLSGCAVSPVDGPSNRETYIQAHQQRGEKMYNYQQQQYNAYTNWK